MTIELSESAVRVIADAVVEKIKEKDVFKKMRADLMHLQTYKMFPYEADTYVKLDEVMKIFEKYTEGDEGKQ